MNLEKLNYNLDKNLIAQTPANPRDTSRLLVYQANKKSLKHDFFYNLDNFLTQDDVLVFNQSRVFPARLKLKKKTDGQIELLLIKEIKKNSWECLVGGKIKVGASLFLTEKKVATLKEKMGPGRWLVEFVSEINIFNFLESHGITPLPPYIKTKDSNQIRKKYQTIYAQNFGSAAAPTAGLHFTKRVFNNLKTKRIQTEFVDLSVGLGTFYPLKEENLKNNKLHKEKISIKKETAKKLNQAKAKGKRLVAVGTTSVRALEAATDENGKINKAETETEIFIKPGYNFKAVDALITNFHLPKSSLMLLVAAFLEEKKPNLNGIDELKKIYTKAIEKKYRFYSFGDAMLIK